MKNPGEQFLHQKDPNLHKTKEVEHEMKRKKIGGEETSQKPADKISDFLEVIKRTHTGHREDPRVLERIKEHYHKEYVIKPEDIPESYYDNQRRLAREQGHGDIEITDEMREQLSEVIINDQNSTLDNWVDYFSSPDSDSYPMWAKYWAFNNMLKLSTFDKEKHLFGKRDKGTVAPFPDLNREALAYVVDAIVKKVGNEEIPDIENNPEFKKILEGSNFGKLYAYAIEKVTPTEENELLNTEGKWVKYPQGSDHIPLVESLQGHGTGWCTAGESTAKTQLEGGDFYVYYSHDKQGKPTIPRVAIRMKDNEIGEVRGIAKEQNLDPYIGEVVQNKLKEFPDGELYQKKTADMEELTKIDKKNNRGEELTKDDLLFLYQLDSKIEGFGYREDPRIQDIIAKRNFKSDISLITGCPQKQISTTTEEVLWGGIKFHYGNLELADSESVKGILPRWISGDLRLNKIKSVKGLTLPERVGGIVYLNSLESVEELKLPEIIGADIVLSRLKNANGLKFPKRIKGDLLLGSIESTEGLELPEIIDGFLELTDLKSAKGLKLPQKIGLSIFLDDLESAEGLELPETFTGNLVFNKLKSVKGLKLPKTLESLHLNNIEFAEGLELPETINTNIYLNSLKSAKGVKFPKKIKGDLQLGSLLSIENLELPNTVNGDISFGRLPPVDKDKLRKKYPNLKII